MAITFKQAYAEQRKSLKTEVVRKKKPTMPALWVILGMFSKRLTQSTTVWYSRLRRTVLYLGGFGFIDLAAWSWNPTFGYLCIGVSLLVLDSLSGGSE